MPNPPLHVLLAIGAAAGILSGLFGIGGGVIIVPALVYFAGFDQQLATGTSLALLLPPLGIGAAFEYYRNGNVDIRSAIVIAIALLVCGWVGAALANKVAGAYLRLAFGAFVTALGLSVVYDSLHRLR